MMKQHILYFCLASLLLLAVAGCEGIGSDLSPQLPDDDSPVPVGFSADVAAPATRSSDGITTNSITSMGVYAGYTGQGSWNNSSSPLNFMRNQLISRTGSSNPWTYTPMKYWPNTVGDKITFFAYAPHSSKLPSPDALTLPENNATGTLKFVYATPTDPDKQSDLLLALPLPNRTKTSGAVAFQFKHMVAKVVFKIKSEEDITLNSMALYQVPWQRDFYVDASGIRWGTATVNDDFIDIVLSKQSVSANTLTEIKTFFLLPNTLIPSRPSTVMIDYNRGGTRETKEMPLPMGWAEGDVRVFTLTLEKGGLSVTVETGSGMSWENGGKEEIEESDIT